MGPEVLSGLLRLLQLASTGSSILTGRGLRVWGWSRQDREALEYSEHLVVQVEKGCNAQVLGVKLEKKNSPCQNGGLALFVSEVLRLRAEVTGMIKASHSVTSTSRWTEACDAWMLQEPSPTNQVLSAIKYCEHTKARTPKH